MNPGPDDGPSAYIETPPRSFWSGKSELWVALGLLGIAAVIGYDTATQRTVSLNVGILGPRVVPTIVAAGLAICAVIIGIQVLRNQEGEETRAESGEDVDLNVPTDWWRLAILMALLVLAALLMPILGFVIVGAALLIGVAFTLGSRSFIVVPIVGVVMALIVYYGFALGLGVMLPAGVLEGIL